MLEEDAERVKKNLSNPLDVNAEPVVIDGINSNEAVQYITARVGELVANIVKQIGDSGLTAADVKSIVLVGGGAQMNGLAHTLEEVSKVKVRMGEQPQSINFLNHTNNRPEYIELFSIIASGAELLRDNESCIEQYNFSEAADFHVADETKNEEEVEKQAGNDNGDDKKSSGGEKKGRSWFDGFKKVMNGLLSESDGDS